mmetsp:Transcript_33926/g.105382  ORF Transcript_33926/g.105382 Transcript_33926/m.105382 type:complete len:271 (+) Transcript_33926:103-915(+)
MDMEGPSLLRQWSSVDRPLQHAGGAVDPRRALGDGVCGLDGLCPRRPRPRAAPAARGQGRAAGTPPGKRRRGSGVPDGAVSLEHAVIRRRGRAGGRDNAGSVRGRREAVAPHGQDGPDPSRGLRAGQGAEGADRGGRGRQRAGFGRCDRAQLCRDPRGPLHGNFAAHERGRRRAGGRRGVDAADRRRLQWPRAGGAASAGVWSGPRREESCGLHAGYGCRAGRAHGACPMAYSAPRALRLGLHACGVARVADTEQVHCEGSGGGGRAESR